MRGFLKWILQQNHEVKQQHDVTIKNVGQAKQPFQIFSLVYHNSVPLLLVVGQPVAFDRFPNFRFPNVWSCLQVNYHMGLSRNRALAIRMDSHHFPYLDGHIQVYTPFPDMPI